MPKTIIFYRSRSGRTKNFTEEIAIFLKNNNIDVKVTNVLDYKGEKLDGYSHVLLGCWTHGLVFFAQRPDKEWATFTKQLPVIKEKKVALFTTYKVLTGSMFKKMKHCLKGKIGNNILELKSRSAELSKENEKALAGWIE